MGNWPWALFLGGAKFAPPHFGPLGIAPGRAQGAPLLLTYYQNTHTFVETPTHTHSHITKPIHTHPHITNPTRTHTHILQNKLKQRQYKIHTKLNSHSTIKYPQYKVTLMFMVLCPQELQRNSLHFTSLHFTSLQNKITSHKSRHFAPNHYTSHHFAYLHSVPTLIPLLVTTFLNLFLNVFSLQRKDASEPAGNCFQHLMVLFTMEYLPTSVLCFLVLIFRLWSSLLR